MSLKHPFNDEEPWFEVGDTGRGGGPVLFSAGRDLELEGDTNGAIAYIYAGFDGSSLTEAEVHGLIAALNALLLRLPAVGALLREARDEGFNEALVDATAALSEDTVEPGGHLFPDEIARTLDALRRPNREEP